MKGVIVELSSMSLYNDGIPRATVQINSGPLGGNRLCVPVGSIQGNVRLDAEVLVQIAVVER